MIKHVSHQDMTGTGPAALTLALAVAYELHAPAPAPSPAPAPRPVEVAPVPELMGLRRTSADRHHRRKVPLRRLNTTVRGLAALQA
ncbi:hypothetical protein AQI88_30450 [Streptomyces cellostaticus]|uniref:Uncharacterized protein n=1 Tax=Streptomyces cellostaticus TaxID=67285 RepID=A0A117PUS9_9ACTN|nr:hypothetical protein [Streptomyces cellostaticus]KUM92703.1 hypothetical protein AQI88_30450 [Streptomyces cellostaticus]GHI06693.1 hypothetical protein Scel_50140 [Streptomyces cellostaticus]